MKVAIILGRHHGEICTFDGNYECKKIPKSIFREAVIPSQACILRPCSHCITAKQTFIMDEQNILYEPSHFILTSTLNNISAQNKANLIHIGPQKNLINPTLLTLEVCLFDKTLFQTPALQQRRLLEHEKTEFHKYNLTVRFDDPQLILPDAGKVIVRTEDFETLYTVPENKIITLPYEILSFKTTISIIYIHKSGQSIFGTFTVAGKSNCQLRHCFFCIEIYKYLKCYPPIFTYTVYTFTLIFMAFIIYFFKFILKSMIYFLQLFIFIFYAIFKFCKFVARMSLLCGSFIGSTLNALLLSMYDVLEKHANQRTNIQIYNLVLLSLCLQLNSVQGHCSTQAVIHSELRSCQSINDGQRMCSVFSTAEVTLPAISSEICLYFTDRNDQHLFSLNIKLDAVLCSFHTTREYFTFPVTPKYLSQISCIYNEYCGQGVHCKNSKYGKNGLFFEAETPESRSFPGVSSCTAGGLGVGCMILTRAACNFYRAWYQPDLINSFEVSKINGHTCQYHISVTHMENNTVSRVQLTDTAYTDTGVKITVLGSYDQPQLHLSESLIQRVGQPTEAYLAPACHRNIPKSGQIGAVQANNSYTTDFIFDPSLSTCEFFEDRLKCESQPDPILNLQKSKEYALPMERNMHLFRIKDGKLHSNLLTSSAVRLQLYFTDYNIKVQTVTVCPQIQELPIEVKGCYNCPILSRLSLSAFSSCQPGLVLINFQTLMIHTKAIQLTTEPKTFQIKFLAEKQCYEEKICLRAQSLIQCLNLNFCLDEPSIELMALNTNYTAVKGSHSATNFWDWMKFPNLNSSLLILKVVGSTLFVICILITLISTVITCCCKCR